MSYLGYLPIVMVVLAAATFGVSYIIAVVRDDVNPAFPYISDTGSERPESNIFGMFLNIAAFLAFCTMYIRFKAVQAITISLLEDRWLSRLNHAAMYIGILSALGCSVVANFQEGTVVETVHIVGAAMTFVLGLVYCFLQCALSYQMCPEFNGIRICRWRLGIVVVSLISLLVTIISAGLALHEWGKHDHQGKTKFHWSSDDPGYSAHLVSTIGEWITALTFLFFFFTYVREFNKFELTIITRPLVRHLDDLPAVGEPDELTKLLP